MNLGNSYSPCFDSYVPQDIVKSGIYKYIRHPIYTANILLLSSLFVASGSLLMLMNTIILAIYYIPSAYKEEKVLSERFQEYKDYQRESGMFIPKVKL